MMRQESTAEGEKSAQSVTACDDREKRLIVKNVKTTGEVSSNSVSRPTSSSPREPVKSYDEIFSDALITWKF